MTTKESLIGVTSRTFSSSSDLRNKLEKHFSNVKYNKEGVHFDDESLISFLSNCEGAIVSEENLTKEVIEKLPSLKVVSKFGVGLDSIDTDFLNKKDIKLCWKPGVNATSVAELALCYLILTLREAHQLNRDLIAGRWSKTKNSRDLSEVTIGIIGFGYIGQTLASYLEQHQTKVLAYDPLLKNGEKLDFNVESVALGVLLKKSDAVTLHVPFTDKTVGMIGEHEISLMKKHSVLVNLSRGGIVSEQAVYKALQAKHLAGAAFDVFDNEPNIDSNLVAMNNFFSTPHVAGTSKNATMKLGLSAINGLIESIDT